MEIHITDSALTWFKEEIGIGEGHMVKFYTQFYGSSPIQPGISLAFTKDNTPIDVAVQTDKGGIVFYVEKGDLWFFDGHDLHVNHNKTMDEIEFSFTKE